MITGRDRGQGISFVEFKEVARELKEYLEKEGVKEVKIGSYYEPVGV